MELKLLAMESSKLFWNEALNSGGSIDKLISCYSCEFITKRAEADNLNHFFFRRGNRIWIFCEKSDTVSDRRERQAYIKEVQ